MENITSAIRTTHRRHVFLTYLDACYATHTFLREGIPDDFELIARKAGFESSEDLSEARLTELKETLLKAPTVRLVTTFILDDNFIETIYPLLFSPDQSGLLDLEVSSSLSGGFIVYRDGIVSDHSFNTLIQQLFSKKDFLQKLDNLV